MNNSEQQQRLQDFMNRSYNWSFTAGECNFLIQLLAHVVQENPKVVVGEGQEDKERLNYQSIRSIVLLNEKLSRQLQSYAEEASIVMGDVQSRTDRVQ